jgi:hypothetical protein
MAGNRKGQYHANVPDTQPQTTVSGEPQATVSGGPQPSRSGAPQATTGEALAAVREAP